MKQKTEILIYFSGLLVTLGIFGAVISGRLGNLTGVRKEVKTTAENIAPTATVIPTPTPKLLTLAEMNQLYGPCVRLPVLMYHHIQDLTQAKKEGHVSLAVGPAEFAVQMQYLKQKGYQTISPAELAGFFDNGMKLPGKPVMLTFDDGYEDFFINAWPVLQNLNMKAVMFLSTGLVNNPGYLNWNQISQMSGKIEFANHTWSHYYLKGDKNQINKEITTAQLQLEERGLGKPEVFAYPYGYESQYDTQVLSEKGFGLAFTTRPGMIECAKKRLVLPRIRVGNMSLANYGL